eukprot:scaffold11104_cov63-Skeletonema_dohrnii-CCMP3373.AAC.1
MHDSSRTITRVMADGSLVGLHPSEARDLRTVDSFMAGKGQAYEMEKKGTSYFDRLTGAGE